MGKSAATLGSHVTRFFQYVPPNNHTALLARSFPGNERIIFRFVFWHSVALCAIVGLIILTYAYVFSGAVPHGLTFVK